MKVSMATLRPAFFMAVMLRAPTREAPAAISKAIFSLMLHST